MLSNKAHYYLTVAQDYLERAVMAQPTGEERNTLTETNMLALVQLQQHEQEVRHG